MFSTCTASPEPVFLNVYGMEPRNRFQVMNSASLCSLTGRYDNPVPTRFLAPTDCLKIPAQGAKTRWEMSTWAADQPNGLDSPEKWARKGRGGGDSETRGQSSLLEIT